VPGVTIEESALFRSQYDSGMSVSQIAGKDNRSKATVHKWLSKTGGLRTVEVGWRLAKAEGRVPSPPDNRKWFLDEGVFSRLLVPETAWLLGLIFGDGYVVPATGRLLLACGPDKDLAIKAGAILSWTGAPVYYNNCWMVELRSKRLVADLAKLGVHQAKTYTMEFPDLPEDLVSHFVRGCWEADGTFYHSGKYQYLYAKYASASPKFLLGLRDVVLTSTGRNSKLTSPRTRLDRVDRSQTIQYSAGSAKIVAYWMYGNSSEAMCSDRKSSIIRSS
jgi:hypothetical protein